MSDFGGGCLLIFILIFVFGIIGVLTLGHFLIIACIIVGMWFLLKKFLPESFFIWISLHETLIASMTIVPLGIWMLLEFEGYISFGPIHYIFYVFEDIFSTTFGR